MMPSLSIRLRLKPLFLPLCRWASFTPTELASLRRKRTAYEISGLLVGGGCAFAVLKYVLGSRNRRLEDADDISAAITEERYDDVERLSWATARWKLFIGIAQLEDVVDFYYRLGCLRFNSNDYDGAEKSFCFVDSLISTADYSWIWLWMKPKDKSIVCLASSYACLAQIANGKNDPENAIRYFRQAIDRISSILIKRDDPDLEYPLALRRPEAQSSRKAYHGLAEHFDVYINILNNYASLLVSQNRLSDARTALKEALQLSYQARVPNHRRSADLAISYSAVLEADSELDRASSVLLEAVLKMKPAGNCAAGELFDLYMAASRLCRKKGQLSNSRRFALDALEFTDKSDEPKLCEIRLLLQSAVEADVRWAWSLPL